VRDGEIAADDADADDADDSDADDDDAHDSDADEADGAKYCSAVVTCRWKRWWIAGAPGDVGEDASCRSAGGDGVDVESALPAGKVRGNSPP